MTSMQNNTGGKLPLFTEETLASLQVLPNSEEARQITVTSGRRCLGSSRNVSPLGLLTRTLLEGSQWTSTRCYLTWKVKVTKSKRLLYQLAVSMPRTEGTGSTLLPTPQARDWKEGNYDKPHGYGAMNLALKLNQLLPTPAARDWRSGRNKSCWDNARPLNEIINLLPTPTTSDGGETIQAATHPRGRNLKNIMTMLPTPTQEGNNNRRGISPKAGDGIATSVGKKTGLKLQPHFVEWMMGFPIGWLDSKPSETPRSRSKSTRSSRR